ncbi:SAM-dependent methyltransferase [Streptosporangium lutulentum]|uniref:S-adenosyl methyltransferase n=1 Tax=Streptosporangium lutulentum TaxID=1461250 RepID=A0ABT9QUV5_9ACTN|nr:SAM-dependent methyltransferase [Streptosporangium lutulentum]MDP9850456.1 hypothetical protein [Streptosporangium lutulentum]
MTVEHETAPEGVDPSIFSTARLYDYLLEGHNNYAADRSVGDYILAIAPEMRTIAKENRECLGRFVNLATSRGIRQFLDLGSGLPTAQNVHQIAQQTLPDARTVYVDSDHTTLLHASALLSDEPNTVFVKADVVRPQDILSHPDTLRILNFDEPIAVLMIALLHFVPDSANPREIVAEVMDAMPVGSLLAITHLTYEDASPEFTERISQMSSGSHVSRVSRNSREIASLFGALPLAEGELVDAGRWGIPEEERKEIIPGQVRVLFGYSEKK